MLKSIKCFGAMILLLSVLSGCTARIGDFTIISSKNIDWSQASSFKRQFSRIEGVDKCHIIIFIPTGVPNMKEALDVAIESVPGCVALLDGALYKRVWWIPYIYGQTSYIVEGTPLLDPAHITETALLETTGYTAVQCDKTGKIVSANSLTKDEFEVLKQKSRLVHSDS